LLDRRRRRAARAASRAVAEFRDILRHPHHRGAVLQAAQQGASWINDPCPSAEFAWSEQITIYQPAEFDQQAKPVAGSWKESVTASGCGGERMLNVLTSVPSPGALVSSVLLAGSTRADPLLQRDSVRYAVAASGGAPPSCRRVYIADTKFIGFEGAPDPGVPPERRVSPWREEWSVVACDKRSVAILHFTPTSTGTNISTNLGETRWETK
jgi:hypothetical protein